MSNLNWVDYVILGIFFFSITAGLMRGFIKEVISLLAIITAFFVAIMFSNPLATAFTSSSSVQNMVNQTSNTIGVSAAQPVSYLALGISFAVLFSGTIIIGALISHFLNALFQTGIFGIGNRLMGAVFGFVRGLIINLVIIFLVQLSPLGEQPWWHQSRFVVAFQPAVGWLGNVVSPSLANLKTKFERTLQNVGSQIQNITGGY